MGRCEGYYRLENRRCDRDGQREIHAPDGERYVVCGYHDRHVWTTNVARSTNVARWHGETGVRTSRPSGLRTSVPERRAFAWS